MSAVEAKEWGGIILINWTPLWFWDISPSPRDYQDWLAVQRELVEQELMEFLFECR